MSNRLPTHPLQNAFFLYIGVRWMVAVFALLLLCLAPTHSRAQEPIRPSMTGAEASIERMKGTVLQEPYNLRLGAARFRLSAGFGVDFNDNINLAESGGSSDLIIGATIGLQGEWKVTPNNALRITLSLGYQKYLDHPQYDSLAVSVGPQSQISYDIFVIGVVKVSIHDRFQITEDPVSQATLSNVVSFRRFQNAIGLTTLWDWNKVILVLGYDHYTDSSLDGAFSYADHSAENANASLAVRCTDATTVGLDSSITYTSYQQTYQNSSTGLNVGPFLEQVLSRYLKLRMSGGLQEIQFQTGGGNGDSSSLNSWYGEISLAHRINRSCTETFSIGHEATLALQSNYQNIDYVRYNLSFKLFKKVTTGISVFYDHVAESASINSETLNRLGGGLNLGYQLTKKLSLNGGFQIVTKQSNLAGYSYTQDRIFLGAQYQF